MAYSCYEALLLGFQAPPGSVLWALSTRTIKRGSESAVAWWFSG